ncbi:DUF5020 family protein [Dasania sp. GY-MA-18]|uniref:DUF5020 family protein n=1 Tax=Dasania phycosphaerae TaxID=2950436 RepID=A0A9J6RMH2_9GAMM|nr:MULTISPECIES: DUF5020 family protein [Dasania]MCR8923492.1 DUF5020 family protein [Dasania sp. GY-MA-18]MCZ0865926.1 DUF5020 family protein [Dasania phycosphaerae]MCZ0869650.1 DUF5020 family protein [Dasania phycosphaerae]
MKKNNTLSNYIFAAISTSLCFNAAQAATWSDTNVEILQGGSDVYDFGTGDFDTTMTTITLEHASGWEYGDNYFFVDIYKENTSAPDDSTTVYSEYYTNLSLSKITGKSFSAGIIKDVALHGGINAGNDFQVLTYGINLNLDLPGFSYAAVSISVYDDVAGAVHRADGDKSYIVTPVWGFPFEIGNTKWMFDGFVDFIGERGGSTKSSILAQPHILFDLGHSLFDDAGKLYIGLEYSWWKNKYGLDLPIERHPQFMIQYNL